MPDLSLACPSCGAPAPADPGGDLMVACTACGAVRPRGVPSTHAISDVEATIAVSEPLPFSAEFLRRFEPMRLLARGTMGTVWLMRQVDPPRLVAVKAVRDGSLSTATVRRLAHETPLVAQLNHPRIAPTFEAGLDRQTGYTVSEYVEGETLAQRLRRNPPLTTVQAVRIMIQVLEGLKAAHRAGVLHRDVKPGNILLTPTGRPRLGDFGVPRVLAEVEPGRPLAGTPAYMSPEACRGDEITQASDVYSAGVVLYELITGQTPFSGSRDRDYLTQHLGTAVPSLRALCPEVPVVLETEAAHALEKDPMKRHRTASSLRKALQDIYRRMSDSGDLTPTADETPPESRAGTSGTMGPGKLIANRYELERLLGQGGAGQVWLASDRVRNRAPVALKVLPPELWRDPEARAAIVSEADISLRLGHPNIVRLYNLEATTTPVLVMEYVPGRTLAEELKARARDGRGPFTPAEALAVLTPLAAALDFAHERTVIHRDVKPSNILLEFGPERGFDVKLGDFGIAAEAASFKTRQTGVMPAGTLSYMSPEQMACQRIDARSDIYSLACTLFQMLTLAPPFSGEKLSWSIKNSPVPRPPGLPKAVCDVLCAGLAKNRDERPRTAGALCEAFRRAIEAPRAAAPAPRPSGPILMASRAVERPPTHSPARIAGTLVLFGGALWFAAASLREPARRTAIAATPAPVAAAPAAGTGAAAPLGAASIAAPNTAAAAAAPRAIHSAGVAAPLMGAVLITGVPADIPVLDSGGRKLGATPGPLQLPAGQHTLLLHPGGDYQDIALTAVTSPGAVQTLSPSLARRTARITVVTTPPGASLFVSGEARGTTPAELDLPCGVACAIEARLAGYQDARTSTTAVAGPPRTLELTLEPVPAPSPSPSPAPSAAPSPSHRQELEVQALEAFDKDDLERAAQLYSEITLADPTYGEAYRKIGQCRYLLKQNALAIRALERGLELAPHDPHLLNTFATVLVETGDAQRARTLAEEATQLAPTDANVWHTLGRTQLKLSQFGKARQAFLTALKLEPSHPEARNDLLAACRKLVEEHHTEPDAWCDLGDARRRLDNKTGARSAYKKALELKAHHARATAALKALDAGE